MVDGYLKLLYPDGVFSKEELEEVLQISLEMRRRVKEPVSYTHLDVYKRQGYGEGLCLKGG